MQKNILTVELILILVSKLRSLVVSLIIAMVVTLVVSPLVGMHRASHSAATHTTTIALRSKRKASDQYTKKIKRSYTRF